jgi:hypothetical protein
MEPFELSVTLGVSMHQGLPDFSLPGGIFVDSIKDAVEYMRKRYLLTPKAVCRPRIFHITNMKLPHEEYAKGSDKWDELGIKTGDKFEIELLLSEFLLPSYRSDFLSHEQYTSWALGISRAVKIYGQSIESFFLNSDGTINHSDMVDTVTQMIKDEIMDPISSLEKSRNEKLKEHPEFIRYSIYLSDLSKTKRWCFDCILSSYIGKSICLGGIEQKF